MENIEKFNPANANLLSKEDLAAMQLLTKEQIKELAAAYPNKANQTAYLILTDNKKKHTEQLYPLSTWENLWSLRKMGQVNYAAVSFKSIFNKASEGLKTAPVQDLTKEEVKTALKKVPKVVTSVPVTAKAQVVNEEEGFEDLTNEAEAKASVAKPAAKPTKTAPAKKAAVKGKAPAKKAGKK